MSKHMEIHEFRSFGYLQEVNRRFFHPLGLALEVLIDEETGTEFIGGIVDSREDPLGLIFTQELDGSKALSVKSEELRRKDAREALMGDSIQGLDWWSSLGDEARDAIMEEEQVGDNETNE